MIKESPDKIKLIGYSLGSTATFYSITDDPIFYEEKVSAFIALSPIVYMNHC